MAACKLLRVNTSQARRQSTQCLHRDAPVARHNLSIEMFKAVRSNYRGWVIPCSLILLTLVPAAAGISRILELTSGATATARNARFIAAPFPVVLHILSVIPFSILGTFQLSPVIRKGKPGVHRALGRGLIPLGLMAALTGLWMTVFYPWPEGDGPALFVMRLAAGTAMTMSIIRATTALRERNFVAHGEWMLRAYAIAMGAGTQVLTHVPYFVLFGDPGEGSRAVLMGAGWFINLCVAEWLIRRSPTCVSKPLLTPLDRKWTSHRF